MILLGCGSSSGGGPCPTCSILPLMGRGGLTPEETGFLDLLGLRVRRARAALGVSRRELAQRSGVSERYLAELESGRGNISILLLKRLATAVGADLQDLLVPAVDLGRRGRLALLGLESATRRDCANALGELLGVPVFHLDVVATATIGGAVAVQRADAEAEISAFAGLVDRHPRCVFSIGEALLVEPRAWRILRARCFSLWLKPSPRSESAPTQAGQEAGAIPSPASTPGEPAPEDRPCPVEPAADPRVAAQPRPDFEENRRALERLLEALLARADLVVESTDQAPAVWAQAILPLVSETPAIVEPVPDAKV